MYFGENIRLYVKTTSSAVSGVPSDHFPFGRSLNTYCVPPFETVGSADATAGIGCPFAFDAQQAVEAEARDDVRGEVLSDERVERGRVGEARLDDGSAGERLGEREARGRSRRPRA